MSNTPGNLDPWAVTLDTSRGIGNSTDDVRYTVGNLGQPDSAGNFTFADGVYPSATAGGVVLDLRVTATSPTPSLSVSINWGGAQVGRLSHGPYQCASTASQTVTVGTPNGSNPRIDYIVMRLQDPGVDTTPTQSWFPLVLQGTAQANPVEPTGQLSDVDLLLAAVTVRAGTTQILAGDISDRRVFVASRGGAYLKSAVDTRPGAFPGMLRYNQATAAHETWDMVANAWVQVVPVTQWVAYTPVLSIATTGQPISLGSGSVSQGRYQVLGKICHIHMSFVWGSGPYNGYSGNIISYLPANMVIANVSTTQWTTAHLAVRNNAMIADFDGQAAADPNTNYVFPWFPSSRSDTSTLVYRIATSQGAAGTGIPNVPGGFPEGGYLTIDGSFEIK